MAARRASDETLIDLLALAERRQAVSGGRALARRAAELGHDVSHTTLNKILAGKSDGRTSTETLDAISALADVSRTRVHQAAGRPAPGRPFADEIPAEADLLNRRQRDAVLGIVRALLDASATGAGTSRAEGPAAPRPPMRAVARRRT